MQTTQSMPQTQVRVLNLPEGAKVANSEPITPVLVSRIRTVGADKQTLELQLEQLFPQPLGNQSGLLAVTMAGHSAFNTGPRKRVTWMNYSTMKAIGDGFIKTWEEVGEAVTVIEGVKYQGWLTFDGEPGQPGGPLLYRFIDLKGKELKSKIVEEDSFVGRTWVNKDKTPGEQRPKTAGNGGDLLIYTDTKGVEHKIYANRHLSVEGMDDPKTGKMWDEDIIITHNNTITGSSVRAAMAKAGISVPTLPGSPAGVPAQEGLQNRRPGYTSNLLRPRPEPTRTAPTAEANEVDEETKAQRAREAGERSIEAQPQS